MRKELLASIWLLGIGCANGTSDDLELSTNRTEARDDDEAGSTRLPTTPPRDGGTESDDAAADASVDAPIDAPVDAAFDAPVDAPIDAPLGGPCGEAACVPVTRKEIGSHFTGPGCTGTESYYTPYNGYDGIRRSWDGKGVAGTMLRTETHRSFKSAAGVCTDNWPSGNTLSNFVRIYR